MTESIWLWVGFDVFVLAMLTLDLGTPPVKAVQSWNRTMILLRKCLVAVLPGPLAARALRDYFLEKARI